MSFYYMAGRLFNSIPRSYTAASPFNANSLYPIANLSNGRPWEPFAFSAAGAATIDFDLQEAPNGEFEDAFSGGLPAAATAYATWGKSAGATVARSTAEHASGVASMSVGTAVGDYAYLDLLWPSGDEIVIGVKAKTSTTNLAGVSCQNLTTGRWLTSSSDWSEISQAFFTATGGTWVAGAFAGIAVEEYSVSRADVVTLRFYFDASKNVTNGTSYYDDFIVYPMTNFVSLHGHDFVARDNTSITHYGQMILYSGPASPANIERATLDMTQPTIFSTFSDVNQRYWRLSIPTMFAARTIGEMVLSQYSTLLRRQLHGQEYVLTHPQDRTSGDLGALQAYPLTARGPRRVRMDFRGSDADLSYAQAKEIMERSLNGAELTLIVVESSDATTAMLGRWGMEFSHKRVTNTVRDWSLQFDEFTFSPITP